MGDINFSFLNLVADGGVAASASSEASGFGVANLKSPHRPFLTWRTTATGESWALFDFGVATPIDVLLLVNTNFATVSVQGNNADSWGSPSFNKSRTITRNPVMWRYQHGFLISGLSQAFTHRYLRLLIPAQTPIDGQPYFSLGGVWAGTRTLPPNNWLAEFELETIQPAAVRGPDHRGWDQVIVLGDARARMVVRRWAKVKSKTPVFDDGLKDWFDIDRQMWDKRQFAVHLNAGDDAQAYVVRHTPGVRWDLGRYRAMSPLELVEVTGP